MPRKYIHGLFFIFNTSKQLEGFLTYCITVTKLITVKLAKLEMINYVTKTCYESIRLVNYKLNIL